MTINIIDQPQRFRELMPPRKSGGFLITLFYDRVEERPLVQVAPVGGGAADSWYAPADVKAMELYEHPFVYEPTLASL